MKPAKMYIPRDLGEILDQLSHMLLGAPQFLDKTGYFPYRNLDYDFQQLSGGLSNIRQTLGEERYQELAGMAARMRAHFEADPEDKTGETLKGCKIIHEMEDILKQVRQKS
jgi:hypothetical protein